MLTAAGLAALERSLGDRRVLSVYLDGTAHDPAERTLWRRELESRLRGLRHGLAEAPHAEREGFERAAAAIEEELASVTAALGVPALVLFATEHGVQHVEELPIRVATSVSWHDGPDVVPYVAVLGTPRSIYIALVDRVRAELLRLDEQGTERLAVFDTEVVVQSTPHMGDAPRSGFHTGTRGTTATDAAQRLRAETTTRLLDQVAEEIGRRAAQDGWVVLGGNTTLLPRLLSLLPERVAARTAIGGARLMDATPSARAAMAREVAAQLREAAELAELASIEAAAAAGGRGAIGQPATTAALARAQVREVLVTPRWIAEHPADARETVRAAFAQGATIEEVVGGARTWLDAHGGIAASLRFAAQPEPER